MKSKIYLPKTLEELKRIKHEKQAMLWARYVPHPYKRQIRALWYYIECENLRLKIEPKHLQKIRKYLDNPDDCMVKTYKRKYNLMPGTELIRTFRGIEHKVMVGEGNEFIYREKTYKTISAVAKEICGKKVSGYDFFGLDNNPNRA